MIIVFYSKAREIAFLFAIAAFMNAAKGEEAPGSTGLEESAYLAGGALSSASSQLWIGCEEETVKGEIVSYGLDDPAPAKERPEYFAAKQNTKYLAIDTGTSASLARSLGQARQNIASGIYIDTFARFAAKDECTAPGKNEKLVISLVKKGSSTRLVVTAGFITTDTIPQAKNYEIENFEISENEWYRLTIEAIENIGAGKVGFKIYIDGEKIVSDQAKTTREDLAISSDIFPSLVQSGNLKNSIGSIIFRGRGDIDDLAITRSDPFADAEISFDGNSFTIAKKNADEIKAILHVDDISKTVPGKNFSFAAAYALGLIDEQTGEIENIPPPSISIAKDGTISIEKPRFATSEYKVTQILQEKSALDGEWHDIEHPGNIGESGARLFRVLIKIEDM